MAVQTSGCTAGKGEEWAGVDREGMGWDGRLDMEEPPENMAALHIMGWHTRPMNTPAVNPHRVAGIIVRFYMLRAQWLVSDRYWELSSSDLFALIFRNTQA